MEIGGDFHLPVSHLWAKYLGQFNSHAPSDATSLLMVAGRSSLRLILKEILKLGKGDEVLLPAYVFEGFLNPFRESKATIKFYKVNADLTIDANDIERKISDNTRLLLIIHYFGFPQPVKELIKLRQVNPSLIIVEDNTQSHLSCYLNESLGKFGDYCFNVFRKYFPVPDGSLLKSNNSLGDLDWKRTRFKHAMYISCRYMAMNLKNVYLHTHLIPKTLHRWFFARAANLLEQYPILSEMSWISKKILGSLDIEEIIARRRTNYQYLLDNWRFKSIVPMFSELPNNVCPLGFIVLAQNRSYIHRELIKWGVYCPILWQDTRRADDEHLSTDIDRKEFPISWGIASKIIMIPIDQRYGIKEMDYILDKLGKFYESVNEETFDSEVNQGL